MAGKFPFRAWFYFRQGWSTYFAFILAAVNTMVVTYYLAIENLPILKEIFPSFAVYLAVSVGIGVPLLILIGYVHFKRSSAYEAEADINVEAYPYWYKLPPGWNIEVLFPLYVTMMTLLVKISNNEKLTKEEIKQISELKKKLDLLIRGGYVGEPRRKIKDKKYP